MRKDQNFTIAHATPVDKEFMTKLQRIRRKALGLGYSLVLVHPKASLVAGGSHYEMKVFGSNDVPYRFHCLRSTEEFLDNLRKGFLDNLRTAKSLEGTLSASSDDEVKHLAKQIYVASMHEPDYAIKKAKAFFNAWEVEKLRGLKPL